MFIRVDRPIKISTQLITSSLGHRTCLMLGQGSGYYSYLSYLRSTSGEEIPLPKFIFSIFLMNIPEDFLSHFSFILFVTLLLNWFVGLVFMCRCPYSVTQLDPKFVIPLP